MSKPASLALFAALSLSTSWAAPIAAEPLFSENLKWEPLEVADADPLAAALDANKKGDYATSVPLMLSLASKGNHVAQNQLGLMYQNGRGVPQSYAEALTWYQRAAAQDDAAAAYNLAGMYQIGLGVEMNYIEAAKWYQRSAEEGLAAAQFVLGGLYKSGAGVPKDFVQAYKWLNLAAARGEEEAGKERNDLARNMTPSQIAEAQKFAVEWRPSPAR